MTVLLPLVVCLIVASLVVHAAITSRPLDESTVREIREVYLAQRRNRRAHIRRH